MKLKPLIFALALSSAWTSSAYAVGECEDFIADHGTSTPCCATHDLTGGGTCYVPADTQFEFSFVNIGFERQDGSVVILGNAKTFNAAAADASNNIGDFLSSTPLPAGTYTALRVTLGLSTTTHNADVSTTNGFTCTGGTMTGLFTDSDPSPICGPGEPNASTHGDCIDPNNPNHLLIRDDQIGTINYDGVSPLTLDFTFFTGNGVACTFNGSGAVTKKLGPLHVTIVKE